MKQIQARWIWYTAAVLLCLTLLSTHLTAGLYARYTTTATGSDSARVAVFNVKEEGSLLQGIQAPLYPGDTEKYSIIVENSSEVAIAYQISLENLTGKLPITWSVWQEPIPVSQENGVCSGQMAPGSRATFVLKLEWPAEKNSLTYMGLVDMLQVNLTAAQID